MKKSKINARNIRERRGLNQMDFWAPLGVTQSGGSRYENGRSMPRPVEMLLEIVYLGRRPPKAPTCATGPCTWTTSIGRR